MRPDQTLFKPHWWGTGLPNRPVPATYGQFDYEELAPPPGVAFDGTFNWLRDEPRKKGNIHETDRCDVAGQFKELSTFCTRRNRPLPLAFVTFFQQLDLAERIRSCTACFLELASDIIPSPKGKGSLVRFLADQQGCVYWYLFIAPDEQDHCVVASTDFFGSEAEEAGFDESDPDSIVFVAPSFEEFIFRFWLENEYWFASNGHGRPSPTAARMLAAYGWK